VNSQCTIIRTKQFGDVPTPKSINELFGLLNECRHKGADQLRIWRGQSDISWPLHSGAYRRVELDYLELNESGIRSYEKRLLSEATHKGYRFLNGRELSDLELLARLQHHGAATRLIDASRSALVALWFAVSNHPDKIGALFGIHSHYIVGGEGEPNVESYDAVMDNCAKLENPTTWEPSGVSPRIAAQHSQFFYSTIIESNLGSLQIADEDDALLAIAITPEFKKECLEVLCDVYDIHYLTLFPDIDGFADANSTSHKQWANYRW
jgi:hypothetical protein